MTPTTYKLLVLDIDGTLINNKGDVSPETREALDLARGAGIQVALCTGRSTRSCRRYMEELSLDGYHIFFDGALVSNPETDERIFIETLTGDTVREITTFARKHDIDIELASVDKYYSERETWSTRTKREYFDIETVIGDMAGVWELDEIIRADLLVTDGPSEEKAKLFMDRFRGSVQYTEAHSPALPGVRFINVTSPGLSKGRALEALAAHLGIRLEEAAAAGDWTNDIPLLTTAGLGIAMGNAHEELKAIADHVTLDVEEHGLAAAIKRFLL